MVLQCKPFSSFCGTAVQTVHILEMCSPKILMNENEMSCMLQLYFKQEASGSTTDRKVTRWSAPVRRGEVRIHRDIGMYHIGDSDMNYKYSGHTSRNLHQVWIKTTIRIAPSHPIKKRLRIEHQILLSCNILPPQTKSATTHFLSQGWNLCLIPFWKKNTIQSRLEVTTPQSWTHERLYRFQLT
jgi:hypothetical protein